MPRYSLCGQTFRCNKACRQFLCHMRFLLPHSMQSKWPAGTFNGEGGPTWLHNYALPRHHACKWTSPDHTACGRILPQPRACTRTFSSHNSYHLILAHIPAYEPALPHHKALGRRCPINGHASGLCPTTRDVSRISPRMKHAVELRHTSRHATDSAPPLATWVDFAQPEMHAGSRCPSGPFCGQWPTTKCRQIGVCHKGSPVIRGPAIHARLRSSARNESPVPWSADGPCFSKGSPCRTAA